MMQLPFHVRLLLITAIDLRSLAMDLSINSNAIDAITRSTRCVVATERLAVFVTARNRTPGF